MRLPSALTAVLGVLLLTPAASALIINNGLAPPNSANVINTVIREAVLVYDSGSGAPTTVELVDGKIRQTVHRHRLAEQYRIEPSTTSRTPRRGTEFRAYPAQVPSHVFEQLCRKGSRAYPGRIGLHDTQDIVKCRRPYPAAGGRCARGGIG